jgi:hypothetical protein
VHPPPYVRPVRVLPLPVRVLPLPVRAALVVFGLLRSLVGRPGAYDPCGRWHRIASAKERRVAQALSLRGIRWTRGPRAGRYSGDFALPDRRVAVEVRSAHEDRKLFPARIEAFRQAGWRVAVIQTPADLLALLRCSE